MHINVAPHCNQGGIVRRAFPRVHLECNDTPRHAEPCIAEDADAATQWLAAATPAHLCVIFIEKGNDMVEAMATDVRGSLRMILETRGAANMDRTTDHKLAGVMAIFTDERF